jgi:transposase
MQKKRSRGQWRWILKSYHFLLYTEAMQKRLAVNPHLSLEAIEIRYRQAKDPVARSHWQIVWLLAQGKTTKQIVEYTGYGLSWIRTIAHRYNEGGPQALGDRRHGNPGAEAILSTELQQQLREALQAPPADQGLWTGRKVAAWIKDKTGRQVHPQRGWEYLKRLGGTLRVPRARHAKADRASQDAFKKTARSHRASTASRP